MMLSKLINSNNNIYLYRILLLYFFILETINFILLNIDLKKYLNNLFDEIKCKLLNNI